MPNKWNLPNMEVFNSSGMLSVINEDKQILKQIFEVTIKVENIKQNTKGLLVFS